MRGSGISLGGLDLLYSFKVMGKMAVFGLLAIVLVLLLGCQAQNREDALTGATDGTVSRNDTYQVSPTEESVEVDTSKALEAISKINEVKSAIGKIGSGDANVDLAKNLIEIAQKNYDGQKYEKALDLAEQAGSLIKGVRTEEEQKAGDGQIIIPGQQQISGIEVEFSHGVATATVFSGVNEINRFSFPASNRIEAIREIAARLGILESYVSEILVVHAENGDEEDDLSDIDGFTECENMFDDFDDDDDPGDIEDNDVEDCEDFFDEIEDSFGRDELKRIDGFEECKDIFRDFNKDDRTRDISPSDVRDCEDFFDELKDDFDSGELFRDRD